MNRIRMVLWAVASVSPWALVLPRDQCPSGIQQDCVDLDFSSPVSQTITGNVLTMEFANVVGETAVKVTSRNYAATDASKTGTTNGMVKINMLENSTADFTLEFVGEGGPAVVANCFHFSLLDVDCNKDGCQQLTLDLAQFESADIYLSDSTKLVQTGSTCLKQFEKTEDGRTQNPTGLPVTPEQSDAAVAFMLSPVASFNFSYRVPKGILGGSVFFGGFAGVGPEPQPLTTTTTTTTSASEGGSSCIGSTAVGTYKNMQMNNMWLDQNLCFDREGNLTSITFYIWQKITDKMWFMRVRPEGSGGQNWTWDWENFVDLKDEGYEANMWHTYTLPKPWPVNKGDCLAWRPHQSNVIPYSRERPNHYSYRKVNQLGGTRPYSGWGVGASYNHWHAINVNVDYGPWPCGRPAMGECATPHVEEIVPCPPLCTDGATYKLNSRSTWIDMNTCFYGSGNITAINWFSREESLKPIYILLYRIGNNDQTYTLMNTTADLSPSGKNMWHKVVLDEPWPVYHGYCMGFYSYDASIIPYFWKSPVTGQYGRSVFVEHGEPKSEFKNEQYPVEGGRPYYGGHHAFWAEVDYDEGAAPSSCS